MLVLDLYAQSPAPSISLTVGKGWALVHERHDLFFTNASQSFAFTDLPDGADLSTLTVKARAVPMRLVTWWLDGAPVAPDRASSLGWQDGTNIVWRPGPETGLPVVPPGSRLWCEIEAPSTGRRPIELVYFMTGLTWDASYSVLLRGGLTNEEERIAVEFDCVVRVANDSSRSFENAELRFVGEDVAPDQVWRQEPGFLILDDDSPLSDLWRDPPPEARPTFEYAARGPCALPARTETLVNLAVAVRQPAERVYKVDDSDLPVEGRQPARPLRKFIVLKNQASAGLGFALPPGEARVFVGSTRAIQRQAAWFSHTPANGEIHIDLGHADQVVASRRTLGRGEESFGSHEETYEVIVENRLGSLVRVDLDETPPTALAWDVVRAKVSYTQRGRQLLFNLRIEPRSTQRVDYTVRVHEPTM